MQKVVLTLFLVLATVTSMVGQSTASVSASATIVNPVSTENISTTGLSSPLGQAISLLSLSTNNIKAEESFTGKTRMIAGIKIWNNYYSFNIIPEDRLVMKNSATNEAFLIEKITAGISTRSHVELNSTVISISAAINISPTQPAGLYKTPNPFDIIISFE